MLQKSFLSCLRAETAYGPEACGENGGASSGSCGQLPRWLHGAFRGSAAPQLLLLCGVSVLGLLVPDVLNALKTKGPPDEKQAGFFRLGKKSRADSLRSGTHAWHGDAGF